MLVACQGPLLLGFTSGWLVAGEIQVMELAVHPDHQGRGVGRQLLSALLQKCRWVTSQHVSQQSGQGRPASTASQHGVGAQSAYRAFCQPMMLSPQLVHDGFMLLL